jgi:hypothetical protein
MELYHTSLTLERWHGVSSITNHYNALEAVLKHIVRYWITCIEGATALVIKRNNVS